MPKGAEASPFALLVGAATAPGPKAADQKTANPSGAESQNDNQPESDVAGQAAAPPAQNPGAQPLTASAGGNSQPGTQPENRQDEDIQALADQDVAPQVPPTIDPAAPPALPPAASQVTEAANDDTTSTDGTISGEDAVALWPQSARPAPQAAPGKPIKTDKSIKKDVTEPAAQPDPAAMLAANTPDQQPAVPPAVMVPPPPAPATQVQPQADQPAIQSAAAPAPVLPQDPAMPPGPVAPQLAAQQSAQQPPQQPAGPLTTDQTNGQTGDQTDKHAMPPGAAMPAVPPVSMPDAAPPAQNKTAPDKAAQARDPVKAQPQAAAPGAKTEAPKAAKATGRTPDDGDPAIVKSADAADQVQRPEAPKPAASQADAPAPKVAVDAIAPPAAQPAVPQIQSPAITQHIQVTAQLHEAKPNVPALAVEIAAKSQGGAKQFDIRLDPPELGRVEVRLSIDPTGKASAHLSADQPQTLTLLQKDAHALTRALRDAGLDVSQDGLNFSLRQQANHEGGAGAHNQAGHRSGRGFALSASASLEAGATSAAYSSPANGHLDIRV